MFEFAFDGALLAFIVSGDRLPLLALLPRRKPRTDGTLQPPYWDCSLNPHRQPLLSLRGVIATGHRIFCLSLTAVLRGLSLYSSSAGPWNGCALRRTFPFSLRLSAAVSACLSAGGAAPNGAARLRFRFSPRFRHRCRSRSRGPSPQTMAHSQRPTKAETGSQRERNCHGENHEPTFSQQVQHHQ